MEIESTGASLLDADVQIKCNHCKNVHVYSLKRSYVAETVNFRVDI